MRGENGQMPEDWKLHDEECTKQVIEFWEQLQQQYGGL
jgi:hypothetical protein